MPLRRAVRTGYAPIFDLEREKRASFLEDANTVNGLNGTQHKTVLPAEQAPINSNIDIPELKNIEHVKCSIRPESRIVIPGSTDSPVLEQFRLLDHRLGQFQAVESFKRVLITSAAPGEGKTVVSINLATTVATTKLRVLLIDSDMRRGSIANRLGIDRKDGLAEVLEGTRTLAQTLCFVDGLNFFFLSSGASGDNSELLNTQTARELFQRLGDAFDLVIFDSCPVLAFSDAHRLAELTDAILIVARTDVTNRRGLEEVVTLLSNYRVLGIVLNGSRDRLETMYHYYYKRKA
jgi:capsular exopolysaccharide synthesis family protein